MMVINDAPPAWMWEGWVLGDLPGLLREASDAIGVGTEVDKVEIVPPASGLDRPEIRLTLSARGDALRPLLERLVDDCYLPGTPDEQARRWEAHLPGLRVVLLAGAGEIQGSASVRPASGFGSSTSVTPRTRSGSCGG